MLVCRESLLVAAFAVLLQISGPPALAQGLPATFEDVCAEYRTLELPLPPPGAKLVRDDSGLAILVNPNGKTPRVLIGLTEFNWSYRQFREVAPDRAAMRGIDFREEDVVLAVQCHACGWGELAQAIFEVSQKHAKDLGTVLDSQAWGYWHGQLSRPDRDRAPALKAMKRLLARNEKLEKQTPGLLKALELALAPRRSKPGSVAALVDDLVDYCVDIDFPNEYQPTDRYLQLLRCGFDAVPELIAHLDDKRLTRARTWIVFGNGRTWNMCVYDVVGDVLEGIAGKRFRENGTARVFGERVTKEQAEKWWVKAQMMGEEAYLVQAAVPPPRPGEEPELEDFTYRDELYLRKQVLLIVAAKHPQRLREVYKKLLDQECAEEAASLPALVAGSSLTAKDKVDILAAAVKHKNCGHRALALAEIQKLDQERFDGLLIEAIDRFPKDIDTEYILSDEVAFGDLAIRSRDPRIWQSLEKSAKRAAVGLRVALLRSRSGQLNTYFDRPKLDWSLRVRYLANFLDDANICVFFGHKGFESWLPYDYHELEVRNFAALEIASLLKIGPPENRDSDEAWAAFRMRMRALAAK